MLPFMMLLFTMLPFTMLPITMLPFMMLPFTMLPFTMLMSQRYRFESMLFLHTKLPTSLVDLIFEFFK